jgi:hypothetical protein
MRTFTVTSNHFTDVDGNPAGGTTYGNGFAIGWQNGPLREPCHIPPATAQAITECPTPGYHETHRYCPSCPWTENVGVAKRDPNGAFVEDVIAAAIDRIEFYQRGKFASDFNARALDHLTLALQELTARTADREARRVEGTHTP